MRKECYTAYVSVNHQVIKSFTDYYYSKAEKRAENWIKEQEIKDADILVEETTDKFMSDED